MWSAVSELSDIPRHISNIRMEALNKEILKFLL